VADRRSQIGRLGEEIAAQHLRRRGYSIIERNARTRRGELDIIARDGATLVFVEVKTGRAQARAGPERPALAVGAQKQRRLRLLAREWLADRRPRCATVRFDVIGITLSDAPDTTPDLEHIEDAM
jgi:putative endonuclease